MALNFTSVIELPSGIELQSAYGRVYCIDPQQGTEIQGAVDIFVSEADWAAGKKPVAGLPFVNNASKPYDRAVDGVDILDFAHDFLIEALGQQGYVGTKQL